MALKNTYYVHVGTEPSRPHVYTFDELLHANGLLSPALLEYRRVSLRRARELLRCPRDSEDYAVGRAVLEHARRFQRR